MITAVETKEKMQKDAREWKVALLDFVDNFRFHRDPASIAVPFQLSDERKDALLAGTIETLCDEFGLDIPGWLYEVPSCRHPYFVSEDENDKAMAIVHSPVRFRLRKVFVLENFLSRV